MEYKHNADLKNIASGLRKNMTKEEKHLWYDFLRTHPARFRRQAIVVQYILDFYSPKYKLAIEIDGQQHYEPAAFQKDLQRTEFLNQYGISVLRFSNAEVHQHFDSVCECIDQRLTECKNKIINDSPIERF